MPTEEVLLIEGRIARNKRRLDELESKTVNACQSIRNVLALYNRPAEIDVERVRAAVADLDALVGEARTLEEVNAQLQERLG